MKIVEEQSLLDVRDGIVSSAMALLSKAEKTTVYAKTETYAQQEVNDLVNGLSDTTVAGQLALKADIPDVNRLLNLKANKADVYTRVDTE